MARTRGTYTLSANIEPNAAAPLDARDRVATAADLTASGTFPYPWIGMETYVVATGKKYRLIGEDPTVLANWEEVGGGGPGTGGHIIEDATGTDMTARSNLQFKGSLEVTDDSTNDRTIVKPKTMTSGDMDDVISELPDQTKIRDLDDLNDVNVPSPSDGQILGYDGTSEKWVAMASGSVGITEIAAANDVNLTSPADGQFLKYDGASEKWVNAPIAAVYHAAGSKTVAQLTSSLLVAANDGCVYNMSDSGETTEDFVEGEGFPIREGDNVGVVNVGTVANPVYKFDLLSGFVDLSEYYDSDTVDDLLDDKANTSDLGDLAGIDKDGSGSKKFLRGDGTWQNVSSEQAQADWNQSTSSEPDYIKNKPESMPASDVHDWAKAASKPSYTASEVGLGNVPNVSTNDQTPTFTQASSRANISSGEKLSVIFGKIMKWFADLGTAAFKNVPSSGDAAATEVVLGSDSRLSDSRTPTSHTHTKSQITDFPTLGTAASKDVAASGNAGTSQVVMGNDSRLTDSRNAADVSAWAKASSKPSYTASEVGLGNVPNVSTNDQTPTFTQSSSRANLTSGEKLSVSLGKIMKWFADLKDLAFIAKDGTSSTKYLRGDGTWQAFPTIPTVNNASLKIQKNGTDVATFTANASSDVTANIGVPTKTSELTNDSGYVTTDHTYNFSGTTFYSGNSSTAEHNANNAVKNGNYYYTSNGPATSLGASTNDGALYVQSYSDSWVGQIAQDYRNGRLFVRGNNNGTWQNWLNVIDSGNIGSQSVSSATTATKATQDSDGNAINSTYVKLSKSSQQTIYNSGSDTPLGVKGNSATATYIAFINSSGTTLGYFGVKNDQKPYFYYGSAKEIITSDTIGSQSVAYATNAASADSATSAGSAVTASQASYVKTYSFTCKTGSTAGAKITLQTLVAWLITKGYIINNSYCHTIMTTAWDYANSDVLQFSAPNESGTATNYELQLAGVIIEFSGSATAYNTGVFRLLIHSAPTNSFTSTSGYTKFPVDHIAEYTCNGSSYSPVWRIWGAWGDYARASDVYSWAKASSKPSYTASEVGAVSTSAASSVNAAITFGNNDSYGIFTSADNYGSIGSSSKYFYRSYVHNIYGTSLNLGSSTNSGTIKITSGDYYVYLTPNISSNRSLYYPDANGTLAAIEIVYNRIFTTDSGGWLTPTLKDSSSTVLTSKNCLGIVFMHASNSGTSSFVTNYYTFGKFMFNSSGTSRVQCTNASSGAAVTSTSVTVTYGYIQK